MCGGMLGVTLDGGILIPNSIQRERQILLEVIKRDHLSTPRSLTQKNSTWSNVSKMRPPHYGNLPELPPRRLKSKEEITEGLDRRLEILEENSNVQFPWHLRQQKILHDWISFSPRSLHAWAARNAASIQTYVYSFNPNRISHSYIKKINPSATPQTYLKLHSKLLEIQSND